MKSFLEYLLESQLIETDSTKLKLSKIYSTKKFIQLKRDEILDILKSKDLLQYLKDEIQPLNNKHEYLKLKNAKSKMDILNFLYTKNGFNTFFNDKIKTNFKYIKVNDLNGILIVAKDNNSVTYIKTYNSTDRKTHAGKDLENKIADNKQLVLNILQSHAIKLSQSQIENITIKKTGDSNSKRGSFDIDNINNINNTGDKIADLKVIIPGKDIIPISIKDKAATKILNGSIVGKTDEEKINSFLKIYVPTLNVSKLKAILHLKDFYHDIRKLTDIEIHDAIFAETNIDLYNISDKNTIENVKKLITFAWGKDYYFVVKKDKLYSCYIDDVIIDELIKTIDSITLFLPSAKRKHFGAKIHTTNQELYYINMLRDNTGGNTFKVFDCELHTTTSELINIMKKSDTYSEQEFTF